MPFLSKMMSLWKNLFKRQQIEKDLHDELQSWIDETVERKIQEGLSPDLARNAAFLEMDGLDRVKALVRQQQVGFNSRRLAGVTMLVAIVAFLGGVGTTLALMRRNPLIPATPIPATQPKAPVRLQPLSFLEGRVIDEATGQPLPYVAVGLQAMRPTRRYTLTDQEGRFSFVNPAGHPYELEVFTRELQVLRQRWTLNQVHFSSAQPPAFTIVTSNGVAIKTTDGDSRQGGAFRLQKSTVDVKEEISWGR